MLEAQLDEACSPKLAAPTHEFLQLISGLNRANKYDVDEIMQAAKNTALTISQYATWSKPALNTAENYSRWH